jgi:hypothetical protein
MVDQLTTARSDEEVSTQRRARILGMTYFDTGSNQKQLFQGMLTNQEMYDLKVVPLQMAESTALFGITTTTPQTTMQQLTQRFVDQRVNFAIISDTGYRDYMRLYDPPQQVVYHDIDINSTDQTNLLQQVSAMLEQVRADDMLAYLVAQAHRLGATD